MEYRKLVHQPKKKPKLTPTKLPDHLTKQKRSMIINDPIDEFGSSDSSSSSSSSSSSESEESQENICQEDSDLKCDDIASPPPEQQYIVVNIDESDACSQKDENSSPLLSEICYSPIPKSLQATETEPTLMISHVESNQNDDEEWLDIFGYPITHMIWEPDPPKRKS